MVSGRCHWGVRRACALAMVLVLASCAEDRVTGVGTGGPSGQDAGAEGVLDAQPPQPEDAALDTGDVRPAPDGSVPDSATAADTGEDSSSDATPGDGDAWTYGWMTSPWSGCSANCGGGTQTREVWCERVDGQRADDVLCVTTKSGEPTDRPADVQVCNSDPCAQCPLGSNICNAQSAQDCNASLELARQRCQDAGCTPAGPAACFQGGSPSNPTCWGAVVECN